MKILHVTKKYPNSIGGDSLVVANLEQCQRAAGHEVVILTTNCDIIKNGEHIYKFGLKDDPVGLDAITLKRMLSMPSLIWQTLRILHKEKPDVIHSHSPDLGFVVSFVAKLYKVPMVHTCHGVTFPDPVYSRPKRALELFLLKHGQYKHIIVLGPSFVKTFKDNGMPHAVFVPNGVDIDFWQPNAGIKKSKPFTFNSVGRLEDQKGFRFLLEACAKLKARHFKFRVIIISEGSQRAALEKLASDLGVDKIVQFVGNKTRAEIRALHAKASGYVSSSIWEGFPLTILEAWAMALPIASTDVGNIAEISPKGATFLVEPSNSQQLADAMEKVLTLYGKPELQKMTDTNVAACIETYNWRAISRKIEGLYAK